MRRATLDEILVFTAVVRAGSFVGTEPWLRAEGRSRLRMDSGEAIRDATVAGLGIALLPAFLVASDVADGRLVQLLPHCETETVRIQAIYPSKRYLPAKVRRFIDLLVQSRSAYSDVGSGQGRRPIPPAGTKRNAGGH